MTAPTQPPPAPATEGPLLRRSRHDRVLAGVCGGLGAYFGIDPVLLRIAFIVLAVLGGPGIIIYLIAWLVMPEETGEVLVRRWTSTGNTAQLIGGVALIAIGGIILIDRVFPWYQRFAWPAAVISAGVLLIAYAARRKPAGVTEGPEHTAPEEAPPAVETQAPPVEPPPPAPSTPSLATTAATSMPAGVARVGRLAFGVVLLVLGIAWLLEVTDAAGVAWNAALAIALALVGLGLIAGAGGRRQTGLVPLGVVCTLVLAVAATSSIDFEGGVGERTRTPATVAEIPVEYELGVGRLVVDLRRLALPEGETQIEASVGIGDLEVRLPEGAAIRVTAEVGAGSAIVRRQGVTRDEDGVDVTLEFADQGFDQAPRRLSLRLSVGLGEVEVRE